MINPVSFFLSSLVFFIAGCSFDDVSKLKSEERPALSESEKTKAKAILVELFQDPATGLGAKPKYKALLKYENDRMALVEAMDLAETQAQKMRINNKIQILDEDFLLLQSEMNQKVLTIRSFADRIFAGEAVFNRIKESATESYNTWEDARKQLLEDIDKSDDVSAKMRFANRISQLDREFKVKHFWFAAQFSLD